MLVVLYIMLYYTSCSAMVLKQPLVYNMELVLMQFASLGEKKQNPGPAAVVPKDLLWYLHVLL
jgi:hypothetical protein